MGRTACTEPQCLYKGSLYLFLSYIMHVVIRLTAKLYKMCSIAWHVQISAQGEQEVAVHLSELGCTLDWKSQWQEVLKQISMGIQTSSTRMPRKVFHVRDFPTFSTVQHRTCRGAHGRIAHCAYCWSQSIRWDSLLWDVTSSGLVEIYPHPGGT
jgi:hypothetical protein